MLPESVASLPKAELHLHLEGSIQPSTVCALTARHGVMVTEQEVERRYAYQNFAEFLETFKWVTSFLRDPQDYALITHDLAEYLVSQRVIYTEVTISIGVMLLRKQRPEANFQAILGAAELFEGRGLHMNWIFDAVRQFGAEAAGRLRKTAKQFSPHSARDLPTKQYPYGSARASVTPHRRAHGGSSASRAVSARHSDRAIHR